MSIGCHLFTSFFSADEHAAVYAAEIHRRTAAADEPAAVFPQ